MYKTTYCTLYTHICVIIILDANTNVRYRVCVWFSGIGCTSGHLSAFVCVSLKWIVASILKARAGVDRREIWRQWVVVIQENMEGKSRLLTLPWRSFRSHTFVWDLKHSINALI